MIRILSFHQFHKMMQKHSSRRVSPKRCSNNLQHISRKTQFIEITFLPRCSPIYLLHICRTRFQQSTSGGLILMMFNPSLPTFSTDVLSIERYTCKTFREYHVQNYQSATHKNCLLHFDYLNETLQNNQDELLTLSLIFLIKISVSICLFKLITITSQQGSVESCSDVVILMYAFDQFN